MRRPLFLLAVAVGVSLSTAMLGQEPAGGTRKGAFTGDFKLTPVDARHMKVDEAISYADGLGHKLDVPAGFITDGASIPRPLWTVVGSPFSGGSHGSYVEAAAVHDRGCESHQYAWEITHMMFFMAMLDSGVDPLYAKLLYYGVRLGGPRWKTVYVPTHGAARMPIRKVVKLPQQPLSQQQVSAFKKELQLREANGNPISIEEIDERTPLTSTP